MALLIDVKEKDPDHEPETPHHIARNRVNARPPGRTSPLACFVGITFVVSSDNTVVDGNDRGGRQSGPLAELTGRTSAGLLTFGPTDVVPVGSRW